MCREGEKNIKRSKEEIEDGTSRLRQKRVSEKVRVKEVEGDRARVKEEVIEGEGR